MQISRFFLLVLVAAGTHAQSLADVLAANNDTLSSFNSLLEAAGYTETLATTTNTTLLAPSNDAIAKLMQEKPEMAEMVKTDKQLLRSLLLYHSLPGVYMAADITSKPQFVGTSMRANVTGGQKVQLVMQDGAARVYSGYRQASVVSRADITYNTGVVHVLDTVLTVPPPAGRTALDMGLTSLAGALADTGLLAALDGMRDLTVFAPTNAAFEAVGNVVAAADNATLSRVLTYHLARAGAAMFSPDLLADERLETVNGLAVTVRMDPAVGYKKFVNGAMLTVTDIIVANGVVHVVDNVLNPATPEAKPDISLPTQAAAFSAASAVSQPPFTSAVSPTTTVAPDGPTGAAVPAASVPTAALLVGGAAAVWAAGW